MWRIHFTAEDLIRTRIAPTLGPLAETLFGLQMMRRPGHHSFAPWRRGVRSRISHQMRPLADLAPAGTWGVDLWTLTGEAPTIEQGVEALLAMRPDQVRTEIEFTADRRGLPSSVWAVADKDGNGRRELADSALACYRALLQPHWPQVRSHLHAERAARGRVLLEGGIERLLTTLHPRIRWNPPVLEVGMCGPAEVRLQGRGLTLVPSLFVGDRLVLLTDLNQSDASPRLVFPAAPDPAAFTRLWNGRPTANALAALLGNNRATVLTRIADGCTTSELAHRAGISLAAASQHASVLREAGLITTRRDGRAVFHALTSLGTNLLEGA